MAEDNISKIKERVDVVDLVSSYLKLQKSGINYKARCPFHNEKTASFFVSPERQIWHCFGCSKGGDVFGFVKEIEGVEFPEALRVLANRAGIELTPFSPEYKQYQNVKTKLYEICELAARFFEKQLHESNAGKKALDYLDGRGLTGQSIKEFQLGWAPDSWNSLSDFLEINFSRQEVVDAGLAIKKDDGGIYDRFRSRIVFPIFDLNNQVVGFSGRILETQKNAERTRTDAETVPGESVLDPQESAGAKYINTPQTLIYDKGRILYGLNKAKLGIREKNRCLVVEGNMDVIMSHQAGVTNVVASSGTALTHGQLKIIKRYTDNLDLCFDADAAGSLATARGADLALGQGFNLGILAIDEPDVKDPADFVMKHGADWAKYAAKSRPFMEFFFESAKKSLDISTALGKKLLTQKLMPFLASIASKVEQAHWVSEIALALKLKEDLVYQELASVKPGTGVGTIDEPAVESVSLKQSAPDKRFNILEETLLALLFKNLQLAQSLSGERAALLSQECRQVAAGLAALNYSKGENIIGQLIAQTDPATALSLEFIYLKAQEFWQDFSEDELKKEFERILSQIKKNQVSARLERLEYDIKEAERSQNRELLASLVAEFSKTAKELTN